MRTLNKEEMLIVYIALMICRQLGYPKPPKRQVLNVVESWKLMKFQPADFEPVPSGNELKWRNDLAWARQELVDRAWLKNTAFDEWELSELGIKRITGIAQNWSAETVNDPAKNERVATSSERLTIEALQCLCELGRGDLMKRKS